MANLPRIDPVLYSTQAPAGAGDHGVDDMLDAFIIERIRREREQREQREQRERGPLPLPLERPGAADRPLEHRPEPRDDEQRDGGAIIVDFTI